MKIKTLHLVSLALILAVAIGATWVWAQQDDTVYYACVNNSSGTIKVFMEPTSCSANEIPITWNRTGPPGPSGLSEAYWTGHGDVHFTSPETQDVLLLDLPQGSFISNITMHAAYLGTTGSAGFSCTWDKIVDGQRSELGGWKVGGGLRLNEQDTFAQTFGFGLWDEDGAQVIVSCEARFFDDADGEFMFYFANWSVIKVDTVHFQEWPPGG